MFDTRARRPVRPSTRFEAPDTSAIPRALAANLDRLPGCEHPDVETSISVRWSDLDVNRHVNNSRYAEWLAEGAAAALPGGPILASLDIDYLAETQHPGSVVVRTQRDPAHPERLGHAIARAEDGVEAVRARTEWRAR
jgi:acyl-CoA thioesterase FadM